MLKLMLLLFLQNSDNKWSNFKYTYILMRLIF